jgi:hypothetical protein
MNRAEKAFLDCIRAEAIFVAVSEAQSHQRPITMKEFSQSLARFEKATEELAKVPAATVDDLRMKVLAFSSLFCLRDDGPNVASRAKAIIDGLELAPEEHNERVLIRAILVDCIRLALSGALTTKTDSARCAPPDAS